MEEEIDCKEANERHGVTCRHGKMPSGELRFRLLKDDGTAYIRTESPPQGGWQNSHFHNKVRETYIVQQGWIGYAELVGDEARYYVYRAGSLFTTQPFVIHNVYLPADSVIHTVKHGEGRGEQRLEDDRTDRFTASTKEISEDVLLKLGAEMLSKGEAPLASVWTYSEAYRHFDGLIWQASVWSTGLFTLALAGMTQVTRDSSLVIAVGMPYESLLAAFSAFFCAFILVISHALYRFRWHQSRAKEYVPRLPLLSPQVGLQAMVNVQATILALSATRLIGMSLATAGSVVLIGLAGVEWYQEARVSGSGVRSQARETRS